MSNPEESTKNPTKLSVSARLESLKSLKSPKKRPQAALLAENLASIENSLLEGFSRQDVWESLREEGFTLTFESFLLSLHRIRKKRAATKQSPQRPEASKPTVANPQTVPPGAPLSTSQPKPEPNIPGEKSALEKKQEAYKAFKESIKDRSEREQRKLLEEWRNQNSPF